MWDGLLWATVVGASLGIGYSVGAITYLQRSRRAMDNVSELQVRLRQLESRGNGKTIKPDLDEITT